MCFNAEVSITTYTIGVLGCLMLIKNKQENYIPEAIFFLWVVHMQLIEFFLWKNQPCNVINQEVSRIGMIVNNMEPIILWFAIILFSEKKLPNWIHAMMTSYVVAASLYTYNIDDSCTTTSPISEPHLDWRWNQGKYKEIFYAFFLLCCILLSIYGLKHSYHAALIFILSFGISFFIYRQHRAVGAMWCFIAAFVPLLLPLIYKINIVT